MQYWMAVFGFLGFLGFLGPNAGLADDNLLTGNDLVERCTASDNIYRGWCYGYLEGYTRGHGTALAVVVLRQAGGNPMSAELINNRADKLASFCMPDGVTIGQMRDIVVAYLQENPAIRHWSAQWLVHSVFAETFPCD